MQRQNKTNLIQSSIQRSKYFWHLLPLLFFSLACSLTTLLANTADEPLAQLSMPTQIVKATNTPMLKPNFCVVTASVLHLRECAGANCRIKDWLIQGDKLSIQQDVNGWYQVTTPVGEGGWVNSIYCGGL